MESIFITGATGFVGRTLLFSSLSKCERVYVLVRSQEKFEFLLGNVSKSYIDKIIPIYGDISKVRLGIELSVAKELRNNVTSVFHVAAEVHHLKTFDDLYGTNVKSVNELLCIFYDNVRINFISTLGAANNINSNGVIPESFLVDVNPDLDMGYLKSKESAEILLEKFRYKRIIRVFRLGYISSNTNTGECLYDNNQFMLFLKSCIQMQCYPNIERVFNFTPVDYVTKFIILTDINLHSSEVFNLFNYNGLIDIHELFYLLNVRGYNVKMVPYDLWKKKLKDDGRNNALFKFLFSYRKKGAENKVLRFGTNIMSYEFDKVKLHSIKNGIEPENLKDGYLETIFDYLEFVGFFPVEMRYNNEK